MKHTKNTVRLLSFLLALTVLLSFSALLGVTASAEDVATEETTTDEPWLYDYEGKQLGTDYAYSFAVIGDTQVLNLREVNYGTQSFSGIYDWIVANKDEKNIQRVIGLGDITDATLIAEYANAEREFAKLAAAGIPYSFIRGNHDATTDAQVEQYATDRKDANGNPFTVEDGIKFQDALTWAEYGSTVDGSYAEDMINTYQKFEVGEVKYLLLNVDYGPSDEVIAWMNDVISSNSDRYVIIATHIYLKDDGSYSGTAGYGGNNSAQTLWDDCIKRHENVVLVLSGHHPSDTLVVREEIGVYNNKVTSILVDPQGTDKTYIAEGGAGLVAMFYFSEDGKTMDIEYYSTVKDAHFMAENQISSLKIVLDEDEKPKTTYVSTSEELLAAMQAGGDVTLLNDIELNPSATATRVSMMNPIAPLTLRSGVGGPYTISFSDESIAAGFAGRMFLSNAGAQPITLLDVIFDGNGVASTYDLWKFNNSTEAAPSILNLGSPDEPGLIPEFRNCTGNQGILYIGNYNIVNVYGAKFYNNTATTAGSDAMYIYKGVLNVYGSLYTEADSIYNRGSTVTLAKGVQVMASVTDGASLTAAMAGTLDWPFFVASTNTVTDNGAAFGAAVLNDITLDGAETVSVAKTKVLDGLGHTVYRSASAVGVPMFTVADGAKLTLTNITLDGNGVADTTTNGGAFKLESGSALTLTGAGEEAPVIRGFSAGMGGAIYSSGALTIENAYIQQNTASSNGGGIYLKGGTFTMNGGLIGGEGLGNVGKCGGGIAIAMSGAVAINGGEISYNSTTATDTADYLGGGIYTTASAANVTISGGTVSNNTANRGAGVYALGNLHVTGTASISNNTAVSHGGGIWSKDNTVTVDGNAKINGNVIGNAYGAAAYIESGATIILGGNAELVGNILNRTSSSGNMQGVVIYASASHVVLKDNASIRDNAGVGARPVYGAIYLYSASSFIMTGGSISGTVGGTSNYDRGGAINAAGSSDVWLLGGVIEGNHSSQYGGAVFSGSTGSLYLIGTTIRNNTIGGTSTGAVVNGAAIYTTSNTYAMGGSITGNYISKKGKSYVAALSAPNANNLFITSSVTPASIPDEVVAFAETEAGKAIFEIKDGVIISKTPLVIEDNGKTTADLVNISGAAITGNLVAGSRVVFEDVAIPLAENYTPDKTTLDAIQLRGADAAYNAEVATGNLVWPSKAYQAYQNAGLTDQFIYRVYWAFRDTASKTLPTVTFDGKAVELGTVSAELAAAVGVPTYEGLSYAEIEMAPKYIGDKISVVFGETETTEYTLAGYLEKLKETDASTAALVDAMLNYGAAAQTYFGRVGAGLVNGNVTTTVGDVPADANNFTLVDDEIAPVFNTAIVDVGSKVSIYVVLNKGDETGVAVTVGGKEITDFEVQYAEGGEQIAIGILDINAADLLKEIKVTVGESSLTYSVPAYAYRMQTNAGATDSLKGIVKALYAYAEAVLAYANAQ